ncbi:hypothetical protein FF1_028552 [Malus domestica]
MLLAGLAANEHFAWKVAHVDYRSVTLTMNVCSSMGLIEIARSSACYDKSIHYLEGPVGSVHCSNAWFVAGRVVACRDAVGEVLRLPLSYFGKPGLGHVASWSAARAGSPKLSTVQGRSLTL